MIFLFNFEIFENKIELTLNNRLSKHMSPDLDFYIKELSRDIENILINYSHLSSHNVLLTTEISKDDKLEINFDKELKDHIDVYDQNLLKSKCTFLVDCIMEIIDM